MAGFLCVDGATQWLTHGHGWPGLLLRGWMRVKNHTRQNDEGPLVAGLRRVSFVETCSYARARQRLALLFARLLLTAATKLRAEGAVAFGNWAVIEVMCRLDQMLRRNASDDFA